MEPDSIQRVRDPARHDDDTPGDRQPLQLLALDPAGAAEPQHERNNRRHRDAREAPGPRCSRTTRRVDSAPAGSPAGLETGGTSGSGPGATWRPRRPAPIATTVSHTTGRQRRDSSDPSGNTSTIRTSAPRAGTYSQFTAHAAQRPAGRAPSEANRRVVGVPRHHRRQLPAQTLHQQQPADRIARHAGHDERPDNAETQKRHAEHDVVVEPRNGRVADDGEPPADDRQDAADTPSRDQATARVVTTAILHPPTLQGNRRRPALQSLIRMSDQRSSRRFRQDHVRDGGQAASALEHRVGVLLVIDRRSRPSTPTGWLSSSDRPTRRAPRREISWGHLRPRPFAARYPTSHPGRRGSALALCERAVLRVRCRSIDHGSRDVPAPNDGSVVVRARRQSFGE